MEELARWGESLMGLARLRLEKRRAVSAEDFAEASRLKKREAQLLTQLGAVREAACAAAGGGAATEDRRSYVWGGGGRTVGWSAIRRSGRPGAAVDRQPDGWATCGRAVRLAGGGASWWTKASVGRRHGQHSRTSVSGCGNADRS